MENKNFTLINECRLCVSKDLKSLINFGSVALGNNLLEKKEKAEQVDEFPLEVMNCQSCNHFQLSAAVNPKILYATNYTYLSGVGQSFVKHINNYVDWVVKKTTLKESSVVVDIGSNDGTCLEAFKEKGFFVCGVDPALIPVEISKKKGIFTLLDFFSERTVKKIIKKFGTVDLVTSQNVLAHVDNLQDTFRNIFALLNNNGFLVFEVGYFKNVLEGVTFDTIYHEHLDYHQGSSLAKFLCSIGFDIVSIDLNKVQGGSIRFLCKKTGKGDIYKGAKKFLLQEKKTILFNKDLLKEWPQKIFSVSKKINLIIKKEKYKGNSCYGYGCPTKATLFLKMANLSSKDLNFIIEDNLLKVGKYLPKLAIPVVGIEKLEAQKSIIIIVLAWNFSDDIIRKIKKVYKFPIKIIIPLPKLRILYK